jgi:hypothetical protein
MDLRAIAPRRCDAAGPRPLSCFATEEPTGAGKFDSAGDVLGGGRTVRTHAASAASAVAAQTTCFAAVREVGDLTWTATILETKTVPS